MGLLEVVSAWAIIQLPFWNFTTGNNQNKVRLILAVRMNYCIDQFKIFGNNKLNNKHKTIAINILFIFYSVHVNDFPKLLLIIDNK